MNATRRAIAVAIGAALAGAAADAGATVTENGYYLNGYYLNGYYLNGYYLNGYYLNTGALNGSVQSGVSLAGLKKDGQQVYFAKLLGSEITGYTVAAGACPTPSERVAEPCFELFGMAFTRHRGAWFVGATIETTAIATKQTQQLACTTAGRRSPTMAILDPDPDRPPVKVPLKITAFHPSAKGATYTMELDDPSAPGQHVCGVGPDKAPVRVIPLEGRWNPFIGPTGGAKISASSNEVTFACLNAALGECAYDLGYRPWGRWLWLCDADGEDCAWTYKDLSNEHQACTRMIRADYCGDGTPHTVAGTSINLYDRHGINDYTYAGAENYEYEAVWDAVGAVNLNCARYQQLFGSGELADCPSLQRFPLSCIAPPNLPGDLLPDGWVPGFGQILGMYPTGLLSNSHVPTCQDRPIRLPISSVLDPSLVLGR